MKKTCITVLASLLLLTSCVQKTYHKTVVYILHPGQAKDIQSVAIRGNDKPLSWDSDTNLRLAQSDSSYRLTVTYLTGYRFTEAKFVINGKFELENKENRRIQFSEGDTTVYEAVFDVENQ